jgi:1,4-dihydroxy-2-naphthoate octaprenyltransferase
METEKMKVPFLKKWIIAMRPWALPASTMPVIFGTSLAVVLWNFPEVFPFFSGSFSNGHTSLCR